MRGNTELPPSKSAVAAAPSESPLLNLKIFKMPVNVQSSPDRRNRFPNFVAPLREVADQEGLYLTAELQQSRVLWCFSLRLLGALRLR